MADTLKDFLIGFGFKVDATSQKRAETAIAQTERRATKAAEDESSKRVRIERREQDQRDRERASAEKKEAERRAKSLKDAQSFVLKLAGFAAKAAATVEASALGVVYAVDKAAKSYDRLSWMAQRTGAKPGSIGAFGYASSQLGSSAEDAHASLEAFGQKLRLYGQGYGQALERLGVKTKDAKGQLRDTAEIATDLGDALRRIQQNGGSTGYTQAIVQAKMFGIDEIQARALMNPEFRKREGQYRSDQAKVGANPDAAAQSGTAFEQSMRHLEEVVDHVGTKINGVLFEKLKPLLDQLAEWFAKNGGRIAEIVARLADDLVKLAAAIGEKIAGADWDKILSNVESMAKALGEVAKRLSGETGLIALMSLFGIALSMKVLGPLAGISRLLAGLAVFAMPPWLLVLLGVGAGAYAGKQWLDKHTPGTPEGNANEPSYDQAKREQEQYSAENELKKHHLAPRSGVKKAWDWAAGKLGGDGGQPTGKDMLWARGRKAKQARLAAKGPVSNEADAHNLTKLTEDAAREAGIDPRIMHGIRAGESGHGKKYDVGDGGSSFGPWQLHYGGINPAMPHPGLGDQFTKETGLDARDPKTIPAQTRWVAKWLQTHSPVGTWFGYHGNRDANPAWGDAGYVYVPPAKLPPMKRGAAPVAAPLQAAPPMPGPGVPQGLKGGGYTSLGLGPDGRPVHLGPSPATMQQITSSSKGDTNVTHNPTFNIHGTGGSGPAMLEAARRTASRGQQDLLRNVMGAEQ